MKSSIILSYHFSKSYSGKLKYLLSTRGHVLYLTKKEDKGYYCIDKYYKRIKRGFSRYTKLLLSEYYEYRAYRKDKVAPCYYL